MSDEHESEERPGQGAPQSCNQKSEGTVVMTNADNYTADQASMQTEQGTAEVAQDDALVHIATPLATALKYAEQGWPVFPCNPKASTDPRKKGQPDKRPLVKDWRNAATTDPEQIRKWWKQWPDALIGIPTGAASGIVVLDSDIEHDDQGNLVKDGEGNLQAELARRGWELPVTMHGITSRGGVHRLFKHVPGAVNRTNVLPNVDVRADGGYIIAPGSKGRVGGAWRWGADEMSDIVHCIEEAPAWLARLFREGREMWAALDGGKESASTSTKAADRQAAAGADPFADHDETHTEDIRRALAGVDELGKPWWDADDYSDWSLAAIALHRHPEGRELWEEWSQTSGKYDGDKAEAKWQQTEPSKEITARKILHRVPHDVLSAWARERSVAEGSSGGDIGNAKAFARRYAGTYACLFPAGRYVRWTGTGWERCQQGEEVEAAKVLAQDIAEAAAIRFQRGGGSMEDEKRLKAAVSLRNNVGKLRAMLDLAKSDPLIAVHQRDFDRDPWLLGVQNGVVDLRTGTLMPPRPEQKMMNQAGAPFDPSARCPRWERFLEVVQPDPEVRAFLQRAVGYTLTGLVDEEKFIFMHGTGANGKSVFAAVLGALLGDYHVTITAGALAKHKNGNNSEADRAIARLPGARLALANETAEGSVWDDHRIKELAARDRIAARKLFEESFDFQPTHTLWVRGNHLPGVHDAGDGFWRRLVPVPFPVKFEEADKIPDLDRQLIDTELAGILAWAVQGCLEWQKGGKKLAVPKVLLAGIAHYRQSTDILGQWLDQHLVRDLDAVVSAAEAYGSFTEFHRSQGMTPPSQMLFSKKLAERGVEVTKKMRGRVYIGWRLADAVDGVGGVADAFQAVDS